MINKFFSLSIDNKYMKLSFYKVISPSLKLKKISIKRKNIFKNLYNKKNTK